MKIYICYYDSPIGRLYIASTDIGVLHISSMGKENFIKRVKELVPDGEIVEDEGKNLSVIQQLQEYFSGKRHCFNVPFHIIGTAFYRKVWETLCKIPFGKTASYKQIATQIGNPDAVRAVGQANNRNPIPIIIPCHRVIGSNGRLVGYGSGLDKKRELLEHEGAI